jgi:hypothetical protein
MTSLRPYCFAGAFDANGRTGRGRRQPADEPANLPDVDVNRARRRVTQTDDVAGLQAEEIARRQPGFEQGGNREWNAPEVGRQIGLLGGRRLPARPLPPLCELLLEGLDRRRWKAEAEHAAHLTDPHLEREQNHHFVRTGHAQHLRPGLAILQLELQVGDRTPRLRKVLEQQLDDRVEHVLLDLGERAVRRRRLTGAAEHAVHHREGDGRIDFERGDPFDRRHRERVEGGRIRQRHQEFRYANCSTETMLTSVTARRNADSDDDRLTA